MSGSKPSARRRGTSPSVPTRCTSSSIVMIPCSAHSAASRGGTRGWDTKPPSPRIGSTTAAATVRGSTTVVNRPLDRLEGGRPRADRVVAAIRVRIGGAVDLRGEGPEPGLVRVMATREAHGQHRPAVEAALEHRIADVPWPSARTSTAFSTASAPELNSAALRSPRRGRQALGELDVGLVGITEKSVWENLSACARTASTIFGCEYPQGGTPGPRTGRAACAGHVGDRRPEPRSIRRSRAGRADRRPPLLPGEELARPRSGVR